MQAKEQAQPTRQPTKSRATAATAATAQTKLTLTIGGVAYAIELASPHLAPPLLERYGAFMTVGPSESDPLLTIHIAQAINPEYTQTWQPPPLDTTVSEMGITARLPSRVQLERGKGTSFTMNACFLSGHFDGAHQARLTLHTEYICVPFEQFFVYLLIDTMLPRNGVLLHSSGILHEGKAYLFSGPSGSGKTTMVLNSPNRTILSDELVLVTYDEASRTYWAHGTPFYGSWGQLGTKTSAPLYAIHFLRKTSTNSLERLTTGESFRRMCQVICSIKPKADMTKHYLQWAENLALKCRMLGFAPDPRVWDFLTNPKQMTGGW